MNIIRILRKEKGLTQEALGKMLNLKKAAISKYETGRVIPDLQTAQKLANILGTTIDDIINSYRNKSVEDIDINLQLFRANTSEREEKLLSFYRGLSVERQQNIWHYFQLTEAAQRRVDRVIEGEYEDMVKEQKSAQDSG